MEEREERECFRCERTGDSVRLFDAISDNKPVVICGMCAQIENIPIIKRPSTEQLKSAERPYTVRHKHRAAEKCRKALHSAPEAF